MADSYVESVAGQIADLALEDQAASGDIAIIDTIAGVMGASSQTLEEAFLTAVRVRKAEARAREMLAQRKANNYQAAPKPIPAPMQYEDDAEDEAPEDIIEDVQDTNETEDTTDEDTDAAAKSKVGMPRRVTR